VTGPGVREQNPVCVRDEPAELRLVEKTFEAFAIGAFGKPDAARIPAKAMPIMVARDLDLSPQGRRMILEQGQQSVRGPKGEDLQEAVILKIAEDTQKVAIMVLVPFPNRLKSFEVE